MQRTYLRFYWPLALMGLAMLMGRQLRNGAAARYPDPERELAVFAIAFSIYSLFGATVIFVPQMANVLARSRRATERPARCAASAPAGQPQRLGQVFELARQPTCGGGVDELDPHPRRMHRLGRLRHAARPDHARLDLVQIVAVR